MALDRGNISQRLEELMQLAQSSNPEGIDELTSSTISILERLYGAHSEKLKAYIQNYQKYVKNPDKASPMFRNNEILSVTLGVVKSVKSEVEAGLIGSLELEAQGGVFGDFVTLARESFDENKDVAAVLVSATLEDALKRFALQNGLDVAEADMAQVINALKAQGSLKGPQAAVVQSYVKLRNKAFHAEWDKIEKETVNSAISFTETFLMKHFS